MKHIAIMTALCMTHNFQIFQETTMDDKDSDLEEIIPNSQSSECCSECLPLYNNNKLSL